MYATQFEGIANFNSNQWLLLEKCLRLLEPFEQVTVKISSTKSLISEVIPMVQTQTFSVKVWRLILWCWNI